MLEERRAAILRAVVEQYIDTAQPVSSAQVAGALEVRVSSATVRNEMTVLEHEGYLVQPHTSAGRVPTDKGYRLFVDQLAQPGSLTPGQRQQVRDFFAKAHGEIEQMLHDTSRLLSGLTDYAGVVVAPYHEGWPIRSVQLVSLGSRALLVVAVLANGAVEKRTLEVDAEPGEERVSAAGAHLAADLVGRTLDDVGSLSASGDPATDALAEAAAVALGGETTGEPEHVFVGGASRVAAAFDAMETVRQVLATLEEQYLMVGLVQEVLDRGLSVSIGAEHGVQPLSECSVVVAPYATEGDHSGSIAVLGPTRMHYPEAMAAVAVVSKRLERWLSEG
jgi:heat-inducible transcriptional repressor